MTQAAVRCVALQQQQQQQQQPLGMLPLLGAPELWRRCPSLAPAAPQIVARALAELGPLPGAAELAARLRLPGDRPAESGGRRGAAACALFANILSVGERAVMQQSAAAAAAAAAGGRSGGGGMMPPSAPPPPPSAQLVAVLLALLALLPREALQSAGGARSEGGGGGSMAGAQQQRRDSDDGDGGAGDGYDERDAPYLSEAALAAAAGCGGRLPAPEPPLDAATARAVGEFGGDAGLALLRRLAAAELPAASAAEADATGISGSGSGSDAQTERAWQACRLIWAAVSLLPQVPRLRALLALGVGGRLPARIWFSLLRPLQQRQLAAAAAGAAAAPGTAAPMDVDGSASPPYGADGAPAAWGDPARTQLPLVALSPALGAFIATADLADLGQALPLGEIYDAGRPSYGLVPLLRRTLWQVIVVEGDAHTAAGSFGGGGTGASGGSGGGAPALRRALAASAGALLQQLAEHNHRLAFAPPAAFVADGYSSERFLAEAAASGLRLGERGGGGATGGGGAGGGTTGGARRLGQLLARAPCLVPFEDRVRLLHRELAADRAAAADAEASAALLAAGNDPWGLGAAWAGADPGRFVAIRRDHLLDDAFERLGALGPERLRGRVRIQYVDEHGAQ